MVPPRISLGPTRINFDSWPTNSNDEYIRIKTKFFVFSLSFNWPNWPGDASGAHTHTHKIKKERKERMGPFCACVCGGWGVGGGQ